MRGKIYVFLEPPDPELWTIIKPIMSHDNLHFNSDYRVSEIIAGFGRLIHKKMEKIGCDCCGLQTVFGFTDSVFVRQDLTLSSQLSTATRATNGISRADNQKISQFLDNCELELGVKIEHKNRFMFTIIFDKKNLYIAWTGNTADRPILKNLDGMSRRYPRWIKQQIEKIAIHLITKSVVAILPLLQQAFEDLDYGRFEAKDLQFTEQLDKNPNQYPNDKKIRVKVF